MEPQAIEQVEQILLPAGVALILVSFLLAVTRKRSKKNSGVNVAARTHFARLHEVEPRRGDLETMVVQIEETGRRVATLLDNKAARLEILIDAADERLEKLVAIENRLAPQTAAGSATHGGDHRQTAAGAAADNVPPERGVDSKVGMNASAMVDPDLVPPAPMPEIIAESDPVAQRIGQLADQGFAPEQIAAELNEYIGKVELVLSLRRA